MQRNPQTISKSVKVLPPISLSATASTVVTVDTFGWRELKLVASLGVIADTASFVVTATETDNSDGTTGATAIAEVTGMTLGGTEDSTVEVGRILLPGRKRYITFVFTYAGSGAGLICATAELLWPEASSIANQTYAFSVN